MLLLNSNRPIVTLFMLMSVDGKISPGDSDELDYDKDFPNIPGLKEGLKQYYDIEQTTDLWSFNSGRVQEKMGVNKNKFLPEKTVVNFVLMDNTHLSEHGIKFFCAKSDKCVVVTSNPNHPALSINEENLYVIYQKKLSLKNILEQLYNKFGCKKLTLQTGGTINNLFLREKLIDKLDIVVAPVLVGGKNTSTLIDGRSINNIDELSKLGVLKLIAATPLKNSYLRLQYKVIS